jgi:hypothetical protein
MFDTQRRPRAAAYAAHTRGVLRGLTVPAAERRMLTIRSETHCAALRGTSRPRRIHESAQVAWQERYPL